MIDAADSFAVTYTLSDHCRTSGQAFVSASVLGFAGYAGGFCGGRAPSVRAVFPDLPVTAANCATAGVSGPAVGILGSLLAQMALNCLLGLEPSPLGRMVSLDLRRLTTSWFSFADAPEPEHGFRFASVEDITDADLVIDLRGGDEAPGLVCARAPIVQRWTALTRLPARPAIIEPYCVAGPGCGPGMPGFACSRQGAATFF